MTQKSAAYGGALSLAGGAVARNCLIYSNSMTIANGYGGGVYGFCHSAVDSKNTITNNRTSGDNGAGGGIR